MNEVYAFLGVNDMREFLWVLFGLGGQLLFMSRFLVQWIASERVGRSVIPMAFWYFSICGGIILLTYAIYKRDPVFILGQSMGVFIYARNLWLIRRERMA
ncbi:MAG: lipid-A-disaccharide synthase N-terminal domain-containing protein [Pseudomonadota bacterium]